MKADRMLVVFPLSLLVAAVSRNKTRDRTDTTKASDRIGSDIVAVVAIVVVADTVLIAPISAAGISKVRRRSPCRTTAAATSHASPTDRRSFPEQESAPLQKSVRVAPEISFLEKASAHRTGESAAL
jgi:hypothetical protein